MQALWAAYEPQMTELTIPFLGDERATWQYPFGDLPRAGATLAMGSDWPVSTPDPLEAIHVAVNRVLPEAEGDDRRPFLPEQALDVDDRVDGVHRRVGLGEPPRRQPARSRSARRPTWPSSTATFGYTGRDRDATVAGDLRRRQGGLCVMTEGPLPDAGSNFGRRVRERLRVEQVIWLTTTQADGTPQPNPVWFVWEDPDTLIVYNTPRRQAPAARADASARQPALQR